MYYCQDGSAHSLQQQLGHQSTFHFHLFISYILRTKVEECNAKTLLVLMPSDVIDNTAEVSTSMFSFHSIIAVMNLCHLKSSMLLLNLMTVYYHVDGVSY